MKISAIKTREVSVILTSFNHGKYIAEAIKSVLAQTYQNFELIIIDDCSDDNSWDIISKFQDDRLITIRNQERCRGVCNINYAISSLAKGKYIAIHHSDDVWLPDKLEKQVCFLNEYHHVAAVFGYAFMIDEDGKEFSNIDHDYFSIFTQANRSRYEWLRRFFYKMNCLCHPSVLIRKSCYDEIGSYDERYGAMPDFDFWIRLCMKHEIHVIQEPLLKFRIRKGEANASGRRTEVNNRAVFEAYKILAQFIELESTEDLLSIFPEAKQYGQCIEKDLIPYFIARLGFDVHGSTVHHLLALDILFNMLSNKALSQKLSDNYGFNYIKFIWLTGEYDLLNLASIKSLQSIIRKLSRMEQERSEVNVMLAQLHELDQRLSEIIRLSEDVDERLIESRRRLDEKDWKIQELRKSASWKITAPLRWLARPLFR